MSNKNEYVDLLLNKLIASGDSIRSQWLHPQGTSTRHFYIDDLLPVDLCESVYSAFPKDGNGFFNRESFREKKKTSADLGSYHPILSDITYAFQDVRLVNAISEIIEFSELEPDPLLYAGGLSMMFKGDFLNPHLDNSHDGARKKYRRLNLLFYVSPNWKAENGGNLELWDESRKIPKTLVAKNNRLVVMETNKSSWHSVSPVVVDSPRCCVSNYYFSNTSPDETEYFHVTSFTGRPEEKVRNAIGIFDNAARNLISKVLKTGRGRDLVNKTKNKL